MATYYIAIRKRIHFVDSWDYVQIITRPAKLTKLRFARAFRKKIDAFDALSDFPEKEKYHVVEVIQYNDFCTIKPVYS